MMSMKQNMKKETSKQKQANKSISEEMLDSCRSALYRLKDYLDKIDFTEDEDNDSKKAVSIVTIIEKMGKAFETLAFLEKKVQSEEDIKGKARGNTKISLFED